MAPRSNGNRPYRKRRRDVEEKAMWRWRRHWSDAATARDRLEEARKGARLCRHLGSRPLASRSVTKMFTNFCCCKTPVCGNWLQSVATGGREGREGKAYGGHISIPPDPAQRRCLSTRTCRLDWSTFHLGKCIYGHVLGTWGAFVRQSTQGWGLP